MNSQENQFLEVPLGIEAHYRASEFASEQVNVEKSKQVYLNTLAVYAVHRYLKWLGVKTDLTQSDSWHPILRNRWNVADLVINIIGKLECRPVLPGETTVSLPPEIRDNRIGYLAVQFSENLDTVQLLGFTKTATTGLLDIRQLGSLDQLIDVISTQPEPLVNLSQWFDGIFDQVWQEVETLLVPRKLAFKSSIDAINLEKVERAKKINLGLLVNRHEFALVAGIWVEENQETGVLIQVHPLGEQEYLPRGLKLKVTLEGESEGKSDSAEVMAREADNWIQLEFTQIPGKQVIVQLSLDNKSVIEKFVA